MLWCSYTWYTTILPIDIFRTDASRANQPPRRVVNAVVLQHDLKDKLLLQPLIEIFRVPDLEVAVAVAGALAVGRLLGVRKGHVLSMSSLSSIQVLPKSKTRGPRNSARKIISNIMSCSKL